MAHKRMFSKSITTSDAFREMPASSQALYFHLGMEADDDGFLDNYRGMMRSINASDDDIKILLAKRFLILFPSKVIVVKHWRINNDLKKDRYHETKHLDEKRALIIKENGSYTESNEMDTERIQDVSRMETQYSIGKDRKEKITEDEPREIVSDEDSTSERQKRVGGNKRKAYDELIRWSEKDRGFPFLKSKITRQYRAFKLANDDGIIREQLVDRWNEMSLKPFWKREGYDWMNVYESFNRKEA